MQVIYIGKDDRLIRGKTYKVHRYNDENKEVSLLVNSVGYILTLDVDVVLSYEPKMVDPNNPESSNACYLSLMSVLSYIDGSLVSSDMRCSIGHLIKTYGHRGLRFTLEKNDE